MHPVYRRLTTKKLQKSKREKPHSGEMVFRSGPYCCSLPPLSLAQKQAVRPGLAIGHS